jgi:lipopolysaccharide export system permease protein
MKALDRYIIRQFLVNYIVLFAIVVILIVTLDAIINIDEFTQVTENPKLVPADASAWARAWAVMYALYDFYAPQIALFYVYAAGVLPIAAAGFTLASMMRNRELIAVLAGGISLYRVAMPLLVIGCALSTLMLIDQELIIPPLREKLARTHRHVKHGRILPFTVEMVPEIVRDEQTGLPRRELLFTAAKFDPARQTLDRAWILRCDDRGRAIERITAQHAAWDAGRGGWRLFDGVSQRVTRGANTGDRIAAASSRPIDFVASTLDPVTLRLRRNSKYRQLLSIRELGALMQSGSEIVPKDELQRLRHGRFSLMVVNVLILAMGLPYFLLRTPGNLMIQTIKAAPLCLGVWAGSFVMMQMGSGGLPPELAAWLPALIYLPVALFMMDRIRT